MSNRSKEIILVFVGGAIGTALRYGAGLVGGDGLWPLLGVNVVGSFGLGWYVAMYPTTGIHLSGFFAVGLLGSLTTFSAFAVQTVLLADGGSWVGAIGWLGGSVVLGLTAAIAGKIMGEMA